MNESITLVFSSEEARILRAVVSRDPEYEYQGTDGQTMVQALLRLVKQKLAELDKAQNTLESKPYSDREDEAPVYGAPEGAYRVNPFDTFMEERIAIAAAPPAASHQSDPVTPPNTEEHARQMMDLFYANDPIDW